MQVRDIGPDFVATLRAITRQDKLIWQQHKIGEQKLDLAYFCPWIFCLDANGRVVNFKVARSFIAFAELEGIEYGLGGLSGEIAAQYARFRIKYGKEEKSIADDKIRKFIRDKRLHEEKEKRKLLKVLSQCGETLISLKNEGCPQGT